jgi:hypothetical protein
MTDRHQDDAALDAEADAAFKRSLAKLFRGAGGDAIRKSVELTKRVSATIATTEALAQRIDRMDGQFAEIAEILNRVEAREAINDRNGLVAERIHAAVFADRPIRLN